MKVYVSGLQLALIKAFGAVLVGNLIVWMPITLFVIVTAAIADLSIIPLSIFSFVFLTFIMHSVQLKAISFQKSEQRFCCARNLSRN